MREYLPQAVFCFLVGLISPIAFSSTYYVGEDLYCGYNKLVAWAFAAGATGFVIGRDPREAGASFESDEPWLVSAFSFLMGWASLLFSGMFFFLGDAVAWLLMRQNLPFLSTGHWFCSMSRGTLFPLF